MGVNCLYRHTFTSTALYTYTATIMPLEIHNACVGYIPVVYK